MKAPDLIVCFHSSTQRETRPPGNVWMPASNDAGFSADWLALTCFLNCDYPVIGNSVGDASPSLLNSE